jgi:hypothetical protein
MYIARTRSYLEKGGVMTRKDSEKDADRPHYYSQFWLDIAAGRRIIGGAKPEESGASEGEAPEAPPSRKAGRGNADGYREAPASTATEPGAEEREFESEETVEQPDIDFGEEIGPEDEVIEDEAIEEEFAAEDALIEDETIEEEFESEEEDFFEEEEEEEEEEEWGRHGRKKPKPSRPVKPPVKKAKRDPRRSF